LLRQEGGENLAPHILLIPIAVDVSLHHTNLVIQTFDETQLHLVVRPLPLELLLPMGEELASPPFAAIEPQLPELLLEQLGCSQALVGRSSFRSKQRPASVRSARCA